MNTVTRTRIAVLKAAHHEELSPVGCPVCHRPLCAVQGARGPVWTCACAPENATTEAPDMAARRWLAQMRKAGRLLSCTAKGALAVAVVALLAYASAAPF